MVDQNVVELLVNRRIRGFGTRGDRLNVLPDIQQGQLRMERNREWVS